MYRIDFHTHTGHSPDSAVPAGALLAEAVRAGVSMLCVTDHDTIGGGTQAATILARRPEAYPGLVVVVGEEVMTQVGEIIGLFLTTTIPPRLSPEETVRHIRGQGGLVTVPHPFDRLRGSRLQTIALRRLVDAEMIDAIEVRNARVTFPSDNAIAEAFARAHTLPMLGASDAHTAGEVGMAWTELDVLPATTAEGLRAQLPFARPGGSLSSPLVHFGSAMAKWGRRLGVLPEIILR